MHEYTKYYKSETLSLCGTFLSHPWPENYMTMYHQAKKDPEEAVTKEKLSELHKRSSWYGSLTQNTLSSSRQCIHLFLLHVLCPWINPNFTIYLFELIVCIHKEYKQEISFSN